MNIQGEARRRSMVWYHGTVSKIMHGREARTNKYVSAFFVRQETGRALSYSSL